MPKRKDRKGKGVSETPFLSRGVSLRVFDGSSFHETTATGESPEAIHAAAGRSTALFYDATAKVEGERA